MLGLQSYLSFFQNTKTPIIITNHRSYDNSIKSASFEKNNFVLFNNSLFFKYKIRTQRRIIRYENNTHELDDEVVAILYPKERFPLIEITRDLTLPNNNFYLEIPIEITKCFLGTTKKYNINYNSIDKKLMSSFIE